MTAPTLLNSLLDQLEWHWTHQLRPRLSGLSDDEYFWAPVPDCWTVHADGSIDFAYPPPEPVPFTTIAWRMAHVIVGVLAMRNHAHFGGPPADYQSWDYATNAAAALAQLDDAHDHWVAGVRALTPAALDRQIGAAEGQWGERPMIDLVLHIHREVIHHGAEISLLRDLYAHNKKES